MRRRIGVNLIVKRVRARNFFRRDDFRLSGKANIFAFDVLNAFVEKSKLFIVQYDRFHF